MQEIQSSDNPSAHFEENEVSLLDILVTLAENAKLLVIGPLLVGLIALGVGYMLPQTFESNSVLQAELGNNAGLVISTAAATASLITSAAVLDPVVVKLGLNKDKSAEQARLRLREQVKVAVGRNDKLVTLTAAAATPQQAQAIGSAVLAQTYLESRPKGSTRARLEAQLAEAKARQKSAENAAATLLKRMEAPAASPVAGSADPASGYANLLSTAASAQKLVGEIETLLEGLSEAQLVQAPTLPEKAVGPKKARLAVGAMLVAGFVLLLFVFIRQALRNSAADAEAAGKLERIRRALGLKN